MTARPLFGLRVPLLALALVAAAGCGEEATAPDVPFQVIEETTFAPSLGVDLARMTRLSSGIYTQELRDGVGAELELGQRARIRFVGWLANGARFTDGEITFLLGNNEVISGFELGVRGMREGGERLLVIPPVLAFGAEGSGGVPPGAVVVYRAELLEIV